MIPTNLFTLIPLLIILSSLAGIAVVVWRKRSHINNYQDNATSLSGPIFDWKIYAIDFFPEINSLIERLKLNEYRIRWLKELEKFLRRARLVSLRLDRLSDVLIKKIRRIHSNDQLASQKISEPNVAESLDRTISTTPSSSVSLPFLKNEEQRLIMEIAKNPKDGSLYESLGDLYIEMANFTDAKESYEAAIELNPQNESLKLKLSSALEKITPLG